MGRGSGDRDDAGRRVHRALYETCHRPPRVIALARYSLGGEVLSAARMFDGRGGGHRKLRGLVRFAATQQRRGEGGRHRVASAGGVDDLDP